MDNEVFADRIARLERSNRRLRLWLVMLTVAILAELFFRPFSVVRNGLGRQMVAASTISGYAVQGFWDTKGQRRLELGVIKSGSPAFYLLGEDQRVRLGLDLQPEPMLTFRDAQGAARIRVNLTADGSPRLSLMDPSGKSGIFLGILADGSPVLRLVDKDGHVLFQAPQVQDDREARPRSVPSS